MTREIYLGLARHILTALGGFLVARGSVDADTMNTGVGAAITLGGVVWSVIDKRK
jgi:hypothetical protein